MVLQPKVKLWVRGLQVEAMPAVFFVEQNLGLIQSLRASLEGSLKKGAYHC